LFVAMCYQLSSWCDELDQSSSVETKLTVLTTVDGQFIILSPFMSACSTILARRRVARVRLRQLMLADFVPCREAEYRDQHVCVSVRPSVCPLAYLTSHISKGHQILHVLPIGNETVPIQLAQCWFPGLAISNAKI